MAGEVSKLSDASESVAEMPVVTDDDDSCTPLEVAGCVVVV